MRVERRFDAAARSVAQCRRFALDATSDLDQSARDAMVLMVSELATNAILHAGTGFVVQIERTDGRVKVTVADEGRGTPVLRQPDVRQLHGRGLQVVRELSDDWGTVAATDGKSTAVWFSLDAAAPGSQWAEGGTQTHFEQASRVSTQGNAEDVPSHPALGGDGHRPRARMRHSD